MEDYEQKPLQSLKLVQKPNSLEYEKERFLQNLSYLVDNFPIDIKQWFGRPKSDIRDILKSLLIMSFNSMSFRRAQSDIRKLYDDGLISTIIPKSTLNDYARKTEIRDLLVKFIQDIAKFFRDTEDTLIIDSTWFGTRMYSGGYRKVYDKKSAPLEKCRKLHITILSNSKIISSVRTSNGTSHDCPFFKELVRTVRGNGFAIKFLLADAGYYSKENYALCRQYGIEDAFIDFRTSTTGKGGKSDLFRKRFKFYKEHPQLWHNFYRYRVIVEGVFSSLKRKNSNYLRAKNIIGQDIELLLKALVHNINIFGKYI
jgi:hypothetical protein